VGTVWETNARRVKGSAGIAATTLVSVGTKLIPVPGSKRFTVIRPSAIEINEAQTNRKNVLVNMRPNVFASPILAMPTTSVEITRGAMIILIIRKNIVVNIEISCEYTLAVSGDAVL